MTKTSKKAASLMPLILFPTFARNTEITSVSQSLDILRSIQNLVPSMTISSTSRKN